MMDIIWSICQKLSHEASQRVNVLQSMRIDAMIEETEQLKEKDSGTS